jgi:hypothetical protein
MEWRASVAQPPRTNHPSADCISLLSQMMQVTPRRLTSLGFSRFRNVLERRGECVLARDTGSSTHRAPVGSVLWTDSPITDSLVSLIMKSPPLYDPVRMIPFVYIRTHTDCFAFSSL